MIYGLYNIATVLSDGARMPEKAHGDEDAAFDLYASEDSWVGAGETVLIPTGVSITIPEGCAGLILPRSGLATKAGLIIPNAPGLIDPGYRGEVKVAVHLLPRPGDIYAFAHRLEPSHHFIRQGDRIAQLLIVPTVPATFLPASALQESVRGSGGFGSTGL